MGRPERKPEHRINDMIRIPKVRLIDENGTMIGEVDTLVAKTMARERNLDLVEVAPEGRPPVCKLLDYGKFKYEEKKKKKKSHTHQQELKEVRLRPRTDEHDLMTKLRHAKGFLEEGHKVLFTVFFRGREQAHKEIGRAMMERIVKELDEFAKVEHELSMMGPRMHLTLMPKPAGPKPKAPKPPKAPEAGTPPGLPPAPPPGPAPAPAPAAPLAPTAEAPKPETKGA